MSKKTSFKNLLKTSGSNPSINLQSVRAQREKLNQIKQPEPPAKKAKVEPPRAAAAAAPPRAFVPATVAAAPSAPARDKTFEPAGMFAGRRPGWVFKAGPLGLGYYVDGDGPPPMAQASGSGGGLVDYGDDDDDDAAAASGSGGGAAAAAASTSALPGGFFDNPQLDPANKGKEVAKTSKAQKINEEMDEFTKLVEADLAAAEDADEVAEEDEEEGKLREAVSVAREMELKLAALKRQREAAVSAAAAATGSSRGAGDAPATAGQPQAGDDDDDDDDDDDEGALDILDWRAKGL